MPFIRKATDNPFGAVPYGEVLRTTPYYKDSSAAAIYPGDFVALETDGGLAVAAPSETKLIGVAAQYSAASTEEHNFLVYDHPEQLFVIQDDCDTTHMARANEGERADLITTTGNTSTFRSNHEIDSSSLNVSSLLPILVIRLHPVEEHGYVSAAAAGGQRKWIVKIAQHALHPYANVDSLIA